MPVNTDQSPLVSIIMCTYNGEKYLDEQMESLVSQTYKNIEIIVVDDVSTDGTVALVEKWMQHDPRISIHRNEKNLGYNRNFEQALTMGTGEYIALCDQDDIWFPYKIERLLSKFDQDDVVLTHARSVDYVNGELQYPKGKLLPPFSGNDPKKLFYDNQIGGHRIMFKRSLAEKISPIPPNMFYDWWIGVQATCNGSINAADGFLVKYRIHGNNSHIGVSKEVKAKHIDHITAWKYFIQIKEMKPEDKAFLARMIEIWEEHRTRKKLFDFKLFSFLLKHRRIIFANRRKLVNDFLHLKLIFYYLITTF